MSEEAGAVGISKDSLRGDATVAFSKWIDPNDRMLGELLARAALHATPNSQELVIDRAALATAIMELGDEVGNNPAAWFNIALSNVIGIPIDEIGAFARSRNQGIRSQIIEAWQAGSKFVGSASTVYRVLPRAVEIAIQVSKKDQARLQDLILAMLEEDGSIWAIGKGGLSDSQRQELQDNFMARLVRARRGNPVALENLLPKAEPIKTLESTETFRRPKRNRDSKLPEAKSQRLGIQTDRPAKIDKLDRKPFAQVLADRIVEARALQDQAREPGDAAFMVHLDGPWGSGKSSVLQFLRDDLLARKNEYGRPAPWLVVPFNAWAFQRLRPPWWSLTNQIYREALRDAWGPVKLSLWAKWQWLRFRADAMTALLFFTLIALAGLLAYLGLSGGEAQPAAQAATGSAPKPAAGGKSQIELIAALVAAGAALYPLSRSLLFGSNSAAQHYAELRSDPYGPIIALFESLVRHIGKPIIVFIDDLDRCDKDYVTELLESIQTMMRGAAITYLVAGDRKWICRSFGERYKLFAAEHDDPGRPLGYNFLDKVFQLSASLPRLPERLRDSYWRDLLDEDREQAGPADVAKIAAVAQAVQANIDANAPSEDIQASLAPLRNDASPEAAAILTKAARHRATPEAKEKTLHRLGPLANLIEANPRAMKRLVNAVGVAEARLYLERRPFEVEALARWTILELRWPLLAEWLAEDSKRLTAKAGDAPHLLETLRDTPAVQHVIGKPRAIGRLTVDAVRALTD